MVLPVIELARPLPVPVVATPNITRFSRLAPRVRLTLAFTRSVPPARRDRLDRGVTGVVDEVGVAARAAVHGIDVQAAVERIVAGPARQAVVALQGEDQVVAAVALEVVGQRVAADRLVAVRPEHVLEPDQRHRAADVGVARDEVDHDRRAAEPATDRGEVEGVDVGAAVDGVGIAEADVEDEAVVAAPALLVVGSALALDDVVAVAADQRVVAVAAAQGVVAVAAVQDVVRLVAGDRIIAVPPMAFSISERASPLYCSALNTLPRA